MKRSGEERGQITLLIIGFALVLLLLVAVVVDASAAYLHRQGLDTIADGAALQGADRGSVGVYSEGIPADRLSLLKPEVDAAIAAYLVSIAAHERYPKLRWHSEIDSAQGRVLVVFQAPLELPLAMPGMARTTEVTATGQASVIVVR